MDIKGVIFDMDGTLTDTLSLCVAAFRQAIEPLSGKQFSDEQIIATFGPSEEGTIMQLAPDHYEQGLSAYLAAYKTLIGDADGVFSGITELLGELRSAGIPMALVTGKGSGSTELTLARYDLAPYFTTVATGSPQGSVKALRIREIVGAWGLDPRDVLYVGDAPSDVTASREAGVRIAAALWSPEADSRAVAALHPDLMFNRVAELLAWFRQQRQDRFFSLVQQLQGMAQTGLTFTRDRYDIERYEALRDIAAQLMAGQSSALRAQLAASFTGQAGYATPKVDTRAIVLRQGKILLVREADDGLWSLPGGWADIGDRPSEAIRREIREETGLEATTERLLGVWDRNLHGHPPYPFHVYKMIFLCAEQGGELRLCEDSLELGFFDPAQLPPLSLTRIVPVEIQTSLRIINENGPTWFD
ncbi:NUDIX hydrolase N-terminal domain-containing protein [Sodalis sp. RH21]|uniref:NUDIX hydrolase N-terminal domain-containing protein n=1 Tax=unclassified Sodalis (in: enterobacteria) TaxID=2636512 RepID=UPI0039B61016